MNLETRHLNEHFDISQLYITFLQVLGKRHFHVQNYRTLKGVIILNGRTDAGQHVMTKAHLQKVS